MGWGEPQGRPATSVDVAARQLAEAVRRWQHRPSCRNGEQMCAALDAYDQAVTEASRRPYYTITVQGGFVP